MLYDFLPPLVFFASLGGVILVVSRVIVRIRRVQMHHSIESAAQPTAGRYSPRAEDLARIIGPSKKSVLIIRNRLLLAGQVIKNALARLLISVQQHRQALFQRVTDRPRYDVRARVGVLRATTRRALSSVKNTTQRWRLPRPAAVPEAPPTPRTAPKLTIVQHQIPAADVAYETDSSPPDGGRVTHKQSSRQPVPALKRARQALETAQFKRAEKILVPYIVKHPKNTRAYMMLAETAVARGNWSEALEIYEQVASLAPRLEGIYAALGKAAFQAGKFTRAIEALQRAHNDNSQDTSVIKLLLKIARRMDNTPLQRSLRGELRTLKKVQKQLP